MSQKLNPNQQELVTNTHDLIYDILNEFELSDNDTEDWYGIAAITLCEAALAHPKMPRDDFEVLVKNLILEEFIRQAEHNDQYI